MEKGGHDVESGKPTQIGWFKMVMDQGVVTPEIINHKYPGSGTEEDPYLVTWIENDPRNPMNFAQWKKWGLTILVAIATLAVAFVSSAFSGGVRQIIVQFNVTSEVITLGISLFVLGFAIGPLMWAPMSELYGRQILFIITYALLTFFNAGAAGSQNIQTLLILRFFAGAFGSSPLTNAGGVIADCFPASERGLAMTVFAAAPFMGPVLGPIVGGFVGETIGWRWVEGIMAIFTGVLWIIGSLLIPETYPPVLLRKRANRLSKLSGKVYVSKTEAEQGKVAPAKAFKTALLRPWVLLFSEPIVLLLSIYMAIIYGTLYMLFSAFPIVYQENRGWSEGIGGLAFLGVAVGMMLAVVYSIWDNKRYLRCCTADPSGFAPPEARLPPAMIGGIAIPIGLFWFAWTNGPNVQFMVSIIAGAPFGFGMVLVFLAIMNYLIDSYVIFAASVLAANAVLRSLFGFAFPLFTTYMYQNLGIHWASTIPAFLALACVPFPYLFYLYGKRIREKCKYASEAAAFMDRIRGAGQAPPPAAEKRSGGETSDTEVETEPNSHEGIYEKERKGEAQAEQEAFDYSYDTEGGVQSEGERYQKIRPSGGLVRNMTTSSFRSVGGTRYEHNPYDVDRVNTRESFSANRSRASSRERGGVPRY